MVKEFRCTAIAAGGDSISRSDDGRVVFVRGALPGELVRGEFTKQARDFARALATEIVEPALGRVEPTCRHAVEGCGGCGWQFVSVDLQRELKRQIVVESLVRIGKIGFAEAVVRSAEPLVAGGHRNSIRALVVGGKVAFRSQESNDPVFVGSCEVADPVLEHLLIHSNFASADEVTLRWGTKSGEAVVIVDPTSEGVRVARHPAVSSCSVVGSEALLSSEQPVFHEIVSAHIFAISAGSFFQTRTDGAELLVRLVRDGIASFQRQLEGRNDVLADLYGGVGLFAATVGDGFSDIVSVEREGCSSADAIRNLAHNSSARAIASDVDEFDLRAYSRNRPTIVVADPARAGLGKEGVARIVEAAPLGVVLVSCDAASLGRDAGLLAQAGYQLRSSLVVDMFPHTSHVEVVTCFDPPI